ncbi:MAG TPA: cupin domain-containing protein [Nitrospirota bacterium]|nr:cupin domain-containing protein [Nitrospirota bacterium]
MLPLDLDSEIEFMDEHARTKMLYDSPQFRAVLFCLEKGQGVPRHVSASEVMMQVYRGSGTVIVGGREFPMKEGEVVVARPNEQHGFRSEGERLVILALIVPSP